MISEKNLKKDARIFKFHINWTEVSKSKRLTKDFIKKYESQLNWFYVLANTKFNEKELKKYMSLSIGRTLQYQKLSEKFLEKEILKKGYNDWGIIYRILLYQNLSEEFIERMIKKKIIKPKELGYLKPKKKFSEEFLIKYKKEIGFYNLIHYFNYSKKFLINEILAKMNDFGDHIEINSNYFIHKVQNSSRIKKEIKEIIINYFNLLN
jgi:hypothetical protein